MNSRAERIMAMLNLNNTYEGKKEDNNFKPDIGEDSGK